MKFENHREWWKDEWQFHKRNPEFPILMLIYIAILIYYIFEEYL